MVIFVWEFVAICDAGVIMRDNCCRVVHTFDGFKYILANFGWVYDGVWFFRADIEGTFCSESVVDYSGGSCVFNATVSDHYCVIVSANSMIGVDVNVYIFSVCNVTRLEIGV